ncbi:MAG: hypothetical protein ACQEXJ_08385 [Myxococcota bacterium]
MRSMLGWLSLLLSTLGALGSTAAPEALLVEVEARRAFAQRWEPAHATVTYSPPADKLSDPDFRPRLETHAVLVEGPEGDATLAGPASHLARATDVEVEFGDGRETRARVASEDVDDDTPLVHLEVEDPDALVGRHTLRWAPADALEEDRRAWMLERPNVRGPDGEMLRPVLVDTALGPKVAHPLGRFRHAPVRDAEGLALLDAEGRVLCVVFRRVPGAEQRSLCTPEDAAWSAPEGSP